jgi:uncharacterized protein (TIGR02145 family)
MKTVAYLFLIVYFFAGSCKKESDSNPALDTVTDSDGNVYHAVKIGTQTWMVENLKTTKYNDSTSIPLVVGNLGWTAVDFSGYCWYNNDSSANSDTYGALYNWLAVKSGKLAPNGWHVASDEDWTLLTTFLGGTDVAGGKMKEKGTGHWISPNIGATNNVGFKALPGGYRNIDGTFSDIGISSNWWASTEVDSVRSWFRGIGTNFVSISRDKYDIRFGFSVRCVKN